VKLLSLLPLAALAGFAGCGPEHYRLTYMPAESPTPLAEDMKPKVFLRNFEDHSGGVEIQSKGHRGVVDPSMGAAVRDAVTLELRRLNIPTVGRPEQAERILDVAVRAAKITFIGEANPLVTFHGALELSATLSDSAGRVLRRDLIQGVGQVSRFGPERTTRNILLDSTLSDAVSKLYTIFEPKGPRAEPAVAAPAQAQDGPRAWSRGPVLPTARVGGSGAYAAGRFYAIGGNVRSAEAYDPATGAWTTVAAPPIDRGAARAVVVGGIIYVLGGCHGLDCASTTGDNWAYDPAANAWTQKASMPTSRFAAHVGAINGKIYAAGGFRSSNVPTAVLEVYDPAANTWSTAASMPQARGQGAFGALGGKLYVAGGYNGRADLADTLVYDPSADAWSARASMPTVRGVPGSATLGGKLYVVGGMTPADTTGGSTTILLYDPSTNQWSYGPTMLEGRYDAVVAAGGGKLFAAGPIGGNQASTSFEFLPLVAGTAWASKASPVAPAVAAETVSRPATELDDLPVARSVSPHSHAVIIGIERYREKLPNADFSSGDARLAAEYYKRVLGVPEENLALLTDDRATKSDFEKYFERWLPNRVEAGDEVFVYFSGHGAPNARTGDAYLVPYDGDPTYIEQTGYPLQKMYEQLSKLPAKQVYVAMDSCFSGAGGRSVIAKGARPLVSVAQNELPAKITVIAASAGDQISNSYQEKGHGLFTYFFLKGLKEKGPDMKAVYDYLKPEVSRLARREYNADQDPQWRQGK